MNENSSRWDEIRKIHIESASTYHVLGGLVLVGVGIWIGAHLFAGDTGFGSNIYAEFIGIVAAYFSIDFLNRRSEERRRKQNLIDRLLRDAVSPQSDVAQRAFFDMWKDGLVFGENSILREGKRKVNLYGASPGKVTLRMARMDGAIMTWSDFSESDFDGAILDNACLGSATLKWASFDYVSLKNANFENADLTHATLIGADLTGANLLGAKIYRDSLYNYAAESPNTPPDTGSPQAILPDGKPMTLNTDLTRFTDQNHRDGLWRSEDPKSPAFRGHYEERLARIKRMSENRPSNFPPFPTPPPPPAGGDAT